MLHNPISEIERHILLFTLRPLVLHAWLSAFSPYIYLLATRPDNTKLVKFRNYDVNGAHTGFQRCPAVSPTDPSLHIMSWYQKQIRLNPRGKGV